MYHNVEFRNNVYYLPSYNPLNLLFFKNGFGGDGKYCFDINECLTANGGCDQNSMCINTVGSRTCTCKQGYAGNGTYCGNVNECLTNNGGCDVNADCYDLIGSRNCTCKSGYTGNE